MDKIEALRYIREKTSCTLKEAQMALASTNKWTAGHLDAAIEMSGLKRQSQANHTAQDRIAELVAALEAVYADLETDFIAQHSVAADRARKQHEETIREVLKKAKG